MATTLLIAGLATLPACAPADPVPTGYVTFHEPAYGYAFEYPDTLDVRVHSAEHVALGREHGEALDAVVHIGVYVASPEEPAPASFEAFAHEQARMLCAADAAGLSARCSDIVESAPAQGEGELSGQALYLRHETHDVAAGTITDESVRGPFFAFDISATVPEARYAALIIHPPLPLEPDEVDQAVLRRITDTLRIE